MVALFTVYDFRAVGGIACLKFVGAMFPFCVRGVGAGVHIDTVLGFLTGAVARTMPEFEGVTLGKTFIMTAVWAQAREREASVTVDRKLGGDYFE